MPLCTIETNLPRSKIPDGLQTKIISFISEILNKPTEIILVTIKSDMAMKRGLTGEDIATVMFTAIGSFTAEKNAAYKDRIVKFFEENWSSIPINRIVFLFNNLEAHQVMIK